MEDTISIRLEPGSQQHLDVINQDEEQIDFEGMFSTYTKKMYKRNKNIIDRFLVAKESLKLRKRQYQEALITAKSLRNQVFENEDSDSGVDDSILGNKVPKFGSQ